MTGKQPKERRREPSTMTGKPTVAVLGGGIGGLSAAHELVRRGFDVTVLEAGASFGGKARSVPLSGDLGTAGGASGGVDADSVGLVGEHGFRFFPAFYRNVVETMREIPDGDGTVADHLVPTRETLVARTSGSDFRASTERPETPGEWLAAFRPQIGGGAVPTREVAHFLSRLAVLLTSCRERRETEFERTSWWEFIDADEMSASYRKHLAHSTQSLVAVRPEAGSARTIGRIYLQLLFGQLDPGTPAERLLDGPTSETWIRPWTTHLREQGVDLRTRTPVTAVESDGRRVTGVVAGGERVTADYYVAALPVEAVRDLLTPRLCRAAPSLRGVERIETAWMNGVQFYLDRDVRLADGHAVYVDSPWALTSVSQRQFWADHDLAARSGGAVEGVLSVIASDWETPGVVHGKPGKRCSRREAVEEVWAQLQAHLNRDGETRLPDDALVAAALDPALTETEDGLENDSPLVVNTVDSLRHRPAAATEAENLVLAADYVRVDTDLATMEAANEAARRAVNAVLDRAGVGAAPCDVWGLTEPRAFEPLKRQDELRHRLGLPHPGEVGHDVWRFARSLRP